MANLALPHAAGAFPGPLCTDYFCSILKYSCKCNAHSASHDYFLDHFFLAYTKAKIAFHPCPRLVSLLSQNTKHWGLKNNKNLFLTILEVGESKIKEPANSVSNECPLPL